MNGSVRGLLLVGDLGTVPPPLKSAPEPALLTS